MVRLGVLVWTANKVNQILYGSGFGTELGRNFHMSFVKLYNSPDL